MFSGNPYFLVFVKGWLTLAKASKPTWGISSPKSDKVGKAGKIKSPVIKAMQREANTESDLPGTDTGGHRADEGGNNTA